jgi:hypothetical protein
MREDFVIGKCDKCGVEFRYYLVHNGFNESSYAYCDTCGKVCVLWVSPPHIPEHYRKYFRKTFVPMGRNITKEMESFIEKCPCGGNFKHDASPRCPTCNGQLSAEAAREYIERNALGTKAGWKWQGNWDDIDAIVIENNIIQDSWKLFQPKLTLKEKIKSFFSKK